MEPKVRAAIRFAESRPGRTCVIGSLGRAAEAMAGLSGTRIHAQGCAGDAGGVEAVLPVIAGPAGRPGNAGQPPVRQEAWRATVRPPGGVGQQLVCRETARHAAGAP